MNQAQCIPGLDVGARIIGVPGIHFMMYRNCSVLTDAQAKHKLLEIGPVIFAVAMMKLKSRTRLSLHLAKCFHTGAVIVDATQIKPKCADR